MLIISIDSLRCLKGPGVTVAMEYPSLSILVPAYNRAEMLKQTLDSLVAQTVLPDNLEVLASNDGSTDNTAQVLDEYRGKLKCLRVFNQMSNLGGAGNWAFLLNEARGDLVFLLSHDDA